METVDYLKFLKSRASIPNTTKFEERLLSYIRVKGALASVITPLFFLFKCKLTHCGVNSFQLYKKEGKWKIIHIVDSRTKEGCK